MRENRHVRFRMLGRTRHRFIRSIAVPMRCVSPATAIVMCLALGWQALVPCCFCAHRNFESTKCARHSDNGCCCCHGATADGHRGCDRTSSPGPDAPDTPTCPFCYAHTQQFVVETSSVRLSQVEQCIILARCDTVVALRSPRPSGTPALKWQLRARSSLVHAQIQLVV